MYLCILHVCMCKMCAFVCVACVYVLVYVRSVHVCRHALCYSNEAHVYLEGTQAIKRIAHVLCSMMCII